MSLRQWFANLFKEPWYKQDEWVEVDSTYVTEIIEEHGCPSWDVGLCTISTYRHKDSCEVRQRLKPFTFVKSQISTTVFTHPSEERVSFDWPDVEVPHISEADTSNLYDGSKYD